MSTREKVIIRVIDLVIIFAIVWISWYWHGLIIIKKNTATSNLFSDSFIFLSRLNRVSLNSLDKLLSQPLPQKKVLFVGDIMLGRGVGNLISKYGEDYPIKNIKPLLSQVDFCIGNLEGPIVKDVPKLSSHSMVFAFGTSSLKFFSSANCKLLSLANNHTLDMKKDGLEETRGILNDNGIQFFGDPLKCNSDFIVQKDNIIFSGFNRISDYACPDKSIIGTITSLKNNNPHKFLVVVMHWGKEYSTSTTKEQRSLAHKMIDAGADLILGSHPHVVEGIEEYKGKLVFYSLGNFIFDQYFSKEVQEELGVETVFYPKMILYRLWPIQSTSSQLSLMTKEQANNFLSKLSQKSSSDLKQQITNGIIKNSLQY